MQPDQDMIVPLILWVIKQVKSDFFHVKGNRIGLHAVNLWQDKSETS